MRKRAAMHAALHNTSLVVAALVRDPTARLLSGFHEIVGGWTPAKDRVANYSWLFEGRAAARDDVAGSVAAAASSRAALLATFDRFLDFQLSFVPSLPLGASTANFVRNFHVAPQMSFLSSYSGERLRVDRLGSLARGIDEELSSLLGGQGQGRVRAQRAHHLRKPLAVQLSLDDVAGDGALQRKICLLVRVDFCCLGFRWPAACANLTCDADQGARA